MMPAASASPVEATVWTMLFSRMVPGCAFFIPSVRWIAGRNLRSSAIEMTALGIDAETVRPIFRPTYALAALNITDMKRPSKMARSVHSRCVTLAGT